MGIFELLFSEKNMSLTLAKFVEKYGSKESLAELGWLTVPELDCTGLKTWSAISNLAVRKGFGRSVKNSWFTRPIALKNQGVFDVKEEFLRKVEQCRTKRDMNNLFTDFPLEGNSRKISDMKRKPEFKRTQACNMHIEELVNYTLPEGLELTSTDAIFLIGRWFTEGHIEEGGDDSLSLTAVGKKIFLIADRGFYSTNLFKSTPTVERFIKKVLDGPTRGEKEHVRFFISKPGTALVQPALCCHTVLTCSAGASLVTGWEAVDPRDSIRRAQVLKHYAPGICARKLQMMKQSLAPEHLAETLETSGARDSEAAVQTRALADRHFVEERPPQKRPKNQKKLNSQMNLPRVKAAILKKKATRELSVSHMKEGKPDSEGTAG